MPRFHFDVQDGKLIPDLVGMELANVDEARLEALRRVSALLISQSDAFWTGEMWTMRVLDKDRRILFSINFSAALIAE